MAFITLGKIRFGVDHLTGPIAEDRSYQNTDAEHAVARGKPQVQEIGAERDELTFDFFFDETFCDPEAEHARLLAALISRTPAPLNVPGRAFRGIQYRVDALGVTVEATRRNGRLVRFAATVTLKEVPRSAFAIAGSAIGVAFTRNAGLTVRIG